MPIVPLIYPLLLFLSRIGLDISADMLDVAVERETEGDLLLGDLGQGLPLRPHSFDGAISISAVQWLCNADRTGADPRARMKAFFTTLYRCLSRGARAVLQLYPNGPEQAEMITAAALRVGFGGGLVVDFPNSTRAKKHFLVRSSALLLCFAPFLPPTRSARCSRPALCAPCLRREP